MIALFSALLVLMIRKGKIKEALVEVNKYAAFYTPIFETMLMAK
jgi:hypothetical protein